MSPRRRKKKNNFNDLLLPISVLISLLIFFNLDFFFSLLKFLFIIFLFGVIIFFLSKVFFKKISVPVNKDPFSSRPKINTRKPKHHNSDNIQETQKNTSSTPAPRGYSYFSRTKSTDKPSRWSLTLLQEMDWKHFEELCLSYFENLGYEAKMSSQGADEGVDIYLYKNTKPGKLFGMVQCKRWKKQVGVEPVRAFFGVQADKNIPFAVFISSSGFSKTAISFCDNKHLKLMSGQELLYQLLKLSPDVQKTLLENATKGDYTTPTCASCNIKMVLRTNKKSGNKFWGCKHYPQCRTMLYLSKT